MTTNEPAASAVRLPPNPVWRSYPGGSVLRRFRGAGDTEDDHFPEDWLASSVPARNGAESRGPDEGISRVRFGGEDKLFPDLLRANTAYGPSRGAGSLGVLLKLLDSAERLHLQAHPDDAYVQARLGGTAGKTECWYILSTRRDDASIYLGFQRPPTAAAWRDMIAAQDTAAMLRCFDPIPVRPGDCYVVPAGVPHAIGAGVFMVELQQPSDWVVRCEFTVGGYTLPEPARFMGLTLDDCLGIFDYKAHLPAAFRQSPRLVARGDGYTQEEIIGPAFHRYFRLHRVRGTGDATWECPGPAVAVFTRGEGRVTINGAAESARRGDTLLLPATATPATWANAAGEWEILLALPPSKV